MTRYVREAGGWSRVTALWNYSCGYSWAKALRVPRPVKVLAEKHPALREFFYEPKTGTAEIVPLHMWIR